MTCRSIAATAQRGAFNPRALLALAAAVAIGVGAWRAGGWQGVALAASAVVLWFLLHYTRIVTVMKRAADRPIGYVGSAVMLNARLKARMPLVSVIGLARALGESLTPEGAEPHVLRWRDPGDSTVTAEFEAGRLARWRLERPAQTPAEASPVDPAPPAPAQKPAA